MDQPPVKDFADVLTLCNLAAADSETGERLFGDSALGVAVDQLVSRANLQLMESHGRWSSII